MSLFQNPEFQFRRGSKVDLPNLEEAEPGFCTDTKELFIGSNEGNIQLAKKEEVDTLNSAFTTLESEVNNTIDEFQTSASQAIASTKQATADANTAADNANAQAQAASDRITELNGVDATQFYERQNQFETDLAEIVSLNVKSPPSPLVGAKGDGVTDDTTALKAIVDYINNSATGTKFSVEFPKGKYLISNTLYFKKPVYLKAEAYVAELKWIGTTDTIMIKLGDDNANADGNANVNYRTNKDFGVVGLHFTGGNANLQYGLYFNQLVTQGRVTNCWFENFNAKWCIYAAKDNWDLVIQGNKHDIEFDSAGVGSTLQTGFFSMFPYGNSRIRILDNLISCHSFLGTMIYMNGAACQILRNKIEACYRAIVVGDECRDTWIGENYFESATLTPGDTKGVISIGSFAGDSVSSNTPTSTFIFNNYVDLHRTPDHNTSYFVAPTTATTLLKNVKLVGNFINAWCSDYTATTPVYQNSIGGQSGNVADHNSYLGVFSNISNWQSGDEAWTGSNSNTNFTRPFNYANGIFEDIHVPQGQTYATSGWRVINGSNTPFQLKVDPSNYIYFYDVNGQYEKVYPSGKIEWGVSATNQEYDFWGYVKMNYLNLKTQKTSGTVINGSVYEDSADGNLKYKNIAGTAYNLARFVSVPASATATGNPGDWSADASYLYICHAANTWKRIAIATW